MKTIIFILSFIAITHLSVFAQENTGENDKLVPVTKKGHYFISPSTGMSFTKDLRSGSSDLDLSLYMEDGYFLSEKLALTNTLGFNYSKSTMSVSGTEDYVISSKYVNGKKVLTWGTRDTQGTETNATTSFLWGLGLRYYFSPKIFLGAGYLTEKAKNIDAISSFNIQLGYAIYLNKSIAIEPSVNYVKGIGTNTMNTVMAKIGLGIYF